MARASRLREMRRAVLRRLWSLSILRGEAVHRRGRLRMRLSNRPGPRGRGGEDIGHRSAYEVDVLARALRFPSLTRRAGALLAGLFRWRRRVPAFEALERLARGEADLRDECVVRYVFQRLAGFWRAQQLD